MSISKCDWLTKVLKDLSQREFDLHGSYADPEYLAVLHGDARQDRLPIVDYKSDQEAIDEAEPIYGEFVDGDAVESRFERWLEPVVGIGLPYQRDVRYTYIYEGDIDAIEPKKVHIERIHAMDVNLELVCSHPDVEMVELP